MAVPLGVFVRGERSAGGCCCHLERELDNSIENLSGQIDLVACKNAAEEPNAGWRAQHSKRKSRSTLLEVTLYTFGMSRSTLTKNLRSL
eukprot:3999831-Prymnesium_polylepis.1